MLLVLNLSYSFGIDDRPALLSLSCTDNDLLHIFQCGYSMSVSCDASEEVAIYCSKLVMMLYIFDIS